MITLEQVQELDAKIKQAVSLISTLREENAQLRSTLSNYENKITDLESMVLSLEDGQAKIEIGLIDAISKLDNLDIVEKKETEETSGEFSPSEETEIVDLEESHENDHSKQAENITEEFSISEENETNIEIEVSTEESKTYVEEATVSTVEEEVIIEELEPVSNSTNNDVNTADNDETILVDETNSETTLKETETVEKSTVEKKKSSDYSIPMLEIF